MNETRMTTADAAVFCQRHVNAIRRWIKTGIRGVKLEAIRVGTEFVTSREALNRFLAATNTREGDLNATE